MPPLNLVGDFGGGGMFLAFGVVCALLDAQKSGKGQVVDAAMVDGAAILMSMFHGFFATGMWNDERGTNLLDTGAHFYDAYECADGQYVSIGSIEPQFYAELMRITGLADDPEFAKQMDRSAWPALKQRLREVFLTKTRDEWCALMEHTDVCFAPGAHRRRGGRSIRTTSPARRSSTSAASRSPRRHRASRARRPRSRARRPTSGSTPTTCCPTGSRMGADEVTKLRESGAVR